METCEDCGQVLPFHLERCPQMSGDTYPVALWPGHLTYEQYQSGADFWDDDRDPEPNEVQGPLADGLPYCHSCYTGQHICKTGACACSEFGGCGTPF